MKEAAGVRDNVFDLGSLVSDGEPRAQVSAAPAAARNPPGRNPGAREGGRKFVAVAPESGSGAPFILIPANFFEKLPRWSWAAVVSSLVLLILAMLYLPAFRLELLASRLENANPAVVHSAMRELIVSGDRRAAARLYDLAASKESTLPTRLRAIDTLGLIRLRSADNLLLRLEMSEDSEPPIREAAGAARKLRVLESRRVRFR
ncbi:MAG: hypothetical protein LBU64_02610 [Planctomycetota bacterium]|jgi:hypothetical protein|nr:hypothetical protein [Planctomycetota bacterium]